MITIGSAVVACIASACFSAVIALAAAREPTNRPKKGRHK